MATEAARLKRKNSREERKTDLTLAGLLAEGIRKRQRRWFRDVH